MNSPSLTPTPSACAASPTDRAAALPPGSVIRPAEPRDVEAIVGLITALAEYEQLTHMLEVTPAKLMPHLFGEQPAAACLVAEIRAEVGAEVRSDAGAPPTGAIPAGTAPAVIAGFALYFGNYSTFLAKPGIYLEDLFVLPAWRGHGLGRALLARLAEIAVARGCGRLEWCVLDWNQPAIDFYQGLGAKMLPEWRLCRVTGEALQGFGR
jgi:GNAT superfamily N-acetyltransferase